ncbi:ATP-dependent Clp protease proteolytic subunit [Streptomyces sp. BH-SS-21]|uniref:ATP-dependent Clp protease proteolytic subunit n=1 Tax=Streptomyces liliiviolaceus TaxID=2823109 RepID=A0A940Y6I6_9ACTN|nr:ATP-dependent Clp protease proteolytic subunit [Streptomyces liliiviolaceus]MBQ0854001.1 ATP-dependent Clp protease proteolytic subunit [Streptomyces liliiviolaceus]
MTRSTNRPSARPSARHVLPEFTERTSSGTRTLDPYSKLLEERIVFLGTPIDDTYAAAVHDTMRYVSCEVETVCLGQAASAAAVLLAAGTPGKRYALPGARVLLQQPHLSEPVQGQASDLAIQADELLRTRARMEELLARHTGRSRERIGADIERDTILDARQALEYGLIDRIVPSRKAALGAPDDASGTSDTPGVG